MCRNEEPKSGRRAAAQLSLDEAGMMRGELRRATVLLRWQAVTEGWQGEAGRRRGDGVHCVELPLTQTSTDHDADHRTA